MLSSAYLLSTKNPREAALQIVYVAERNHRHIADVLRDWERYAAPSSVDYRLAQELTLGMKRRELSLQYFCRHRLPTKKNQSLKPKQRIILYMALYQYVFMQRIPLHAIVNESVNLAKRYCPGPFGGFINAVLRKLPAINLELPRQNWEAFFSYPKSTIGLLIESYPKSVEKLLATMNQPPKLMMRIRPGYQKFVKDHLDLLEPVDPLSSEMVHMKDSSKLSDFASERGIYIQNITPVHLMRKLSQGLYESPRKILDLCSAPGGKLLMAHDLYPDAKLWANDHNAKRLERLSQNCRKYGITASISGQDATSYAEADSFDLIILDVPCSNSGVLHKRVEARYRITKEFMQALQELQIMLIKQASKLLSPNGQIWYLTCSIFKQENEEMIALAQKQFHLKLVERMYSILPNSEGWDGGFACALTLPREELLGDR